MLRLSDLQQFIALADELNFRLAAERLHVSQPTLSQTLQRLERQLGTVLIKRTTRSSHLTKAGETLASGAQLLLSDARALSSEVQSVGAGLHRRLRVGAVNPAMRTLIPQVLHSVHTEFPDIRISLQPMSSFELLRQLRERRLDLAIVRSARGLSGFTPVALMQDPLLAVLPAGHRLAGEPSLKISSLNGETFVMAPRSRNPEFHDGLNSIYRSSGCTPGRILEVSGLHSQLALIGAGVGVAVQSMLYRDDGRDDVRFIPVDASLGIPLQVLYPDDDRSGPVEHFVKAALQRTAQLIGSLPVD